MDINAYNFPKINGTVELSKLLVGQRLTVEVISSDKNQQGLVSLGGRIHPAKLEANVQAGDRFLAAVRETNGQEIILARENISGKITGLTNEQLIFLLNRGLGLDPKMFSLMKQFTQSTDTALMSILISKSTFLESLVKYFWKNIPQWSQTNAQTYNNLVKYYYMLGLEHERDIYQLYKKDPPQKKTEQLSAKEQILILLKENTGRIPSPLKDSLQLLLDRITAQQMWIQTGARDNAYVLMHLPIQQDGMLYQCQIAVESSRKGNKIDIDYCHIALQVETQNLGKVGADLRLFEQKLQICLLSDNPDQLHSLVENMFHSTKEKFTSLAITLEHIMIKSYEEYPQFTDFINGQCVSGVDIRG